MAEDTLSPVRYDRRIVKTNLGGRERYALACALHNAEKRGQAVLPAAFVRHVLLVGLEALGWNEERIIKEYAEYEVECLRNGKVNPYESE